MIVARAPADKVRKVTINLDAKLAKRAKITAIARGLTFGRLVEKALRGVVRR
jgi:predicted DNA binding CopG/RHH family protein